MLEKRWIVRDAPQANQLEDLMRAINASAPLATLLLQRGIHDFESAKTFFNPSVKQLHDPFLMKDMDKAADRITRAINQDENILIYGDYDVDGTTAVALVYGFLSKHSERVSFYIPDRYKEGYGISKAGIEFASDNEVSLIIALDCGIKAHEQIALANELGVDVIVCDHHLPSSDLPPAFAILNPLQPGCAYPFKSLCGCGIGYKLISAVIKSWELDPEEAFSFLDLVAIATAADIVSMTGENRVLTFLGLKLMKEALRPGIAMMLEDAGLAMNGRLIKSTITVSDLVFKISPRLNAAGRMQHGSKAVELLSYSTQKSAQQAAASINDQNAERKEVDKEILEEALQMLDNRDGVRSRKSTVLFAEHWHKGVVGIAASRIQETYYRPTIILTESNGKASGSARSVNGFDVHEAIASCADLLENFGGHPAAAGLTLPIQNIEEFSQRFEKYAQEHLTDEMLIPTIDVDLQIDLNQITRKFFDQVERLAPFGPHNLRPQFVSRKLSASAKTKRVGDGTHLKLEVFQEKDQRCKLNAIAFGFGELHDVIRSGKTFDMVFSLELNEFRGRATIQLMVKDIRINDE